jgi:hypothetical protein
MVGECETIADVKAYDPAKARLDDGSDELIPLEITERRLRGGPALRIRREHRKLGNVPSPDFPCRRLVINEGVPSLFRPPPGEIWSVRPPVGRCE